MIVLEKVSKSFNTPNGTISLFSDISASFIKEKKYIITGPSGVGKSTLLSIVASYDKPTAGTVQFNGNNIHSCSLKDQTYFRSYHIGFLFQKAYLINEISVIDNVALPALISGNNKKDAYERAAALLNSLKLFDKKDARPLLLSGGQQQRVALARALANNPTFLLADEPTAFQDTKTAAFLIDFIINAAAKNEMGIIMNSHDHRLFEIADCVYVLDEQKLLCTP